MIVASATDKDILINVMFALQHFVVQEPPTHEAGVCLSCLEKRGSAVDL